MNHLVMSVAEETTGCAADGADCASGTRRAHRSGLPATMHVSARCVALKAPCLQAEFRIWCPVVLLVWKMR
jgi:hypothetical protein